MAKKPETKFKEKVLEDLHALPDTWCEKIQQTSIRGTPDILACMAGAFVALELKKDAAEQPDPLQLYKLGEILRCGGAAYVTHPGNWAETLECLKERFLGQKPPKARKRH